MAEKLPCEMTPEELAALPEVPEAERDGWLLAQRWSDVFDGHDFCTLDGRECVTIRGSDGRWYKMDVAFL